MEDAGCVKLVRDHAIKPCKDLDFETRFKCRATCGICQARDITQNTFNSHDTVEPGRHDTKWLKIAKHLRIVSYEHDRAY